MLRIVCCLFLLVSAYISAQEQYTLSVFTEHFPPYNFAENDKVKGINVDLVRQMCVVADINCAFELTSWPRAIRAAKTQNHTGVMSTSRRPDRESQFQWVGPLAFSTTTFYRLSTADHIQIDNMADLLNYRVGIARSDVYEAVLAHRGFAEGKNLLVFSRKNEEIRAFFAGRLDFILGSPITIPYTVAEIGRQVSELTPAWQLEHPELKGNFLALNLDVPVAVTQRLQSAVDQLRSKGEIDKIISRYAPSPSDAFSP